MATTQAATHSFSISRDMIEVTRSGLLGGVPDLFPQFTPGLDRYYIDDVEVSRDEFITAGGERFIKTSG
jgi:hypothetical protein